MVGGRATAIAELKRENIVIGIPHSIESDQRTQGVLCNIVLEINEFRSNRIHGLRFELPGIVTLLTGMTGSYWLIAWLRHPFFGIMSKSFLHHERVIIDIATRHSDDIIVADAVDASSLGKHRLPAKSMRESVDHG